MHQIDRQQEQKIMLRENNSLTLEKKKSNEPQLCPQVPSSRLRPKDSR